MSKIVKPWESGLSRLIPYLAWGGLAASNRSGWTTARHSNTCYELHIILEGSCDLAFDADIHAMQPGQAVFIAPNVFHAPSNVSKSFCRFSLSFSVDPSLLPTLSSVNTEGYHFFEPDSRIAGLCADILRELDSDGFMGKEITSALFSQLMVLCLRAVREETDIPTSSKPLTQEDEIERIDNFFAMYPPERQTRQELAEYLHCSQRQLIRKMQALYGVSFRQKLINSRMDLARYLLRSTDKSVNEISSQVGYADNAAFFRAFRQHTGMTPAQYRKEKSSR